MNYRINTEVFTNIFALPVSIVDEHLRLAGTMQLRTVLWLFRHSAELPASKAVIAKALGIDEQEAEDALSYWVDKGIILCDEGAVAAVQKDAPEKEDVVFSEPPVSDITVQRHIERITVNPPTHEEVAKRLTQSRDLREIFQTTEESLGATLSYNMQSTLVMLYDDYGFSAGVIALLVEFAVNRKKPTQRFIANTGKIWCDREIDTVEKAMEYIEEQGTGERLWTEFRELAGVKNPSPTKSQREYLYKWTAEMGFNMEMIMLSYEEMANNTEKFSFPYMNKVLSNWKNNGIKTPSDVEKAKRERAERLQKDKEGKPASDVKTEKKQTEKSASYDLNAFTGLAFSDPTGILKRKGGA